MAQIPHLNTLYKKYKEQGLVVVGVTSGSESSMKSFIESKGIEYPIALDSKAGSAYGVRGIPDALLIGADGKVLWKGHPASLTDSVVEKSLEGVTFIRPLPEKLARYNALLRAKKFGKAYIDLKKALASKKVSKDDVNMTLTSMEKSMKQLLDDGIAANESKDFYTAGLKLGKLSKLYSGTEKAKEGEKLLRSIKKDTKASAQIRAVRTLEQLDLAMAKRLFAPAYKGYRSLLKKFPDTTIAEIASEKIAYIEKKKLYNYRSSCPACKKDGETCSRHRS